MSGGLAEAGEETWKGAWTDCPSCTLGALEGAGPPSPGTAPLTVAHQSPLCTMGLLAPLPELPQVPSSGLSRPCCPRAARLAHSGPSRRQQAWARGGPRGCEECEASPSKAKYWEAAGEGALALLTPLTSCWPCPDTGHFLMGTWEPQVRWVRSGPHLPRPWTATSRCPP